MTERTAHPKVLPLLVERWSPRAFDGSELPQDDLDAIFSAAGLAPSAYNVQPWRFLYARRGDANWDRFLSLLVPFNQSWAKDASVLVFVLSDTLSNNGTEDLPNRTHSFDAGAAWMALAVQAQAMGYHTHGMGGVDFDAARTELKLPERFRLEAAVAIGRIGPVENLPEGLRAGEIVTNRKPVAEIAAAGDFTAL